MLQTIRVEIDPSGAIHPLQPLPKRHEGEALLTLVVPDEPALNMGGGNIESLFGVLRAKNAVSIDEMDVAIRQHAKASFRDCD